MSDVQLDPWAIAPITGGSVALSDIVGRDGFIVEVLQLLQNGNNLLVVDPRRMGKTSVLKRLCNEPGPNFDAVLVDLEGADTVEECFSRIVRSLHRHTAIWRRVKRVVETYVESVDVTKGPVKIKAVVGDRSIIDVLGDVIAAIDSQLGNEDGLIIAIDELPMAVESIMATGSPEVAGQLLHRLRHLRQSTTSIRWILAGSIGFHHVVKEVGSTEGVIGDLSATSPGPLAPADAKFLARCLLLGIDRPHANDVPEAFADVAGGIPYVMHHVAHGLKRHDGTITVDDINTAFVTFANDRDASRAMTHLLTRLDNPHALPLLDHFAVHGDIDFTTLLDVFTIDDEPVERDVLLGMLDSLSDDHYLEASGNGHRWKYDVLRRVWVLRRKLQA